MSICYTHFVYKRQGLTEGRKQESVKKVVKEIVVPTESYVILNN